MSTIIGESIANEDKFSHLDIRGWFNWPELYSDIVWSAGEPATFVEIGVAFGKSLVYLGQEILRSKKDIKLVAVDIWPNDNTYHTFFANTIRAGINHLVKPMRMTSVLASHQFGPESLDFVFIDGDHHYEAVRLDIQHWCAKLKPGGRIAGHDAHLKPVRDAVYSIFKKDEVQIWKNSWVVNLWANSA